MMNNSYKKDILKNIIGSKGVTLGSPQANNTVKFCFTTNLATAATNNTAGALTFAVDANGNAGIWAQGSLVSSKIQDISTAAASGNKHGGKTVTVTYIVANTGATNTHTFDVIDEAALEAYFSNSKTIELDSTTDKFEVITDGTTILVDENNGLKSGLKLVYVPASAASGDDPAVDAHIALSDNSNTELYTIPVASIVGNGVLDHSSYDKQKNELHLFFKTAQAGVFNEVVIPVGEILDVNDIFIKNDSSIYLTATADSSVMNLGVLLADPSTAAADATGLADAWKVKQYVDSKSSDLAVESESRNSYIDSSVIAENNKKVWVAAQVAELTITQEDEADTTITGIAGKLVDASDTAAKVQSFVNTRISEEISKLDSSVVFNDGNYISAGFNEVNGKLNGVWVNNTYGAFGTPTHDDASIGATAATPGIAKAENAQAFVIDAIKTLDASLNATTNDVSIYLEQVDGKVTSIGLEHSVANVTFTKKDGDVPANLTGSGSFVLGTDIAKIKSYVDAVAAAGFDDLDSQVVEKDNEELVTVTTGIVNGKLLDASCSVALTRGVLDASFGTITVTTDGLITASEMADSVTTALKWHIL